MERRLTSTCRERPAAESQPKLNAGEVLERIGTVQRENLQRLDNDIAILTKYLQTRGAPKATIDDLDILSIEANGEWQAAVERIEGLLQE
jgi:hypothetical protein